MHLTVQPDYRIGKSLELKRCGLHKTTRIGEVERAIECIRTFISRTQSIEAEQIAAFKRSPVIIRSYDLTRYTCSEDIKKIKLFIEKKTSNRFLKVIDREGGSRFYHYPSTRGLGLLESNLNGNEITVRLKDPLGAFETHEASFWCGGKWRDRHADVYNAIEEIILKYTSHLGSHNSLNIVELCAGKGELAKKIDSSGSRVDSYLVSDLDVDSLKEAKHSLQHNPRFSVMPLDVVNGDFTVIQQKPNVVIISGGLTTMVLTTPAEARRALKKVYRLLEDQGILILTGFMPLLVGPTDFSKILSFKILNRVDLSSLSCRNRELPEFYILKKSDHVHGGPLVSSRLLDCFLLLENTAKQPHRLSKLLVGIPKEEIEELDLSETNVSTEELVILKDFSSLITLRLAGCQDFDLMVLKEVTPPSCRCLDLSGTAFTATDIERLMKDWDNSPFEEIMLGGCQNISLSDQAKWRLGNLHQKTMDLSFLERENYPLDSLEKVLERLHSVQSMAKIEIPSAYLDYQSGLSLLKLVHNGNLILQNIHFIEPLKKESGMDWELKNRNELQKFVAGKNCSLGSFAREFPWVDFIKKIQQLDLFSGDLDSDNTGLGFYLGHEDIEIRFNELELLFEIIPNKIKEKVLFLEFYGLVRPLRPATKDRVRKHLPNIYKFNDELIAH